VSGSVDVAVIGAGPWGLAAAWRIASRGARVTLVDDGGEPTAAVAAGMLAPWSEVSDDERDMHRAMVAAAGRWPGFADELAAAAGLPSGFARTGSLLVAARPEHLPWVRRLRETLLLMGETADWRPGSRLRALEPGLAPAVAGGLDLPGEHQADPRLMLPALRAACADAGVEVAATPAERLERAAGGRIGGVALADGRRLTAGRVVLAAGWRAGRLAARVPLRPVKGQILTLSPRPGAADPGAPIARIVRTPAIYIVPRPDGRVVLGATMEEAGDRDVTAGAVHELLDEALHVVPELGELVLAEALAGLRPAAPDGRPALGEDPADGLVWAVGGFRHGILFTPLVADALAAIVAEEPLPAEVEPFGPERFPESRAVAASVA
jgi:glycine oxidase